MMNIRRCLKKPITSMAVACLLGALCTASAFAAPVQWKVADGGNDHFYEAVLTPNITWNNAKNAAAGSSYNGVKGYLATFATSSEQDWVIANLGGGTAINVMWLGGYQDFSDPGYSEPSGGWKWITGETFLLSGPNAPSWSFNNAYYIAGGEQYTCTWWNTGGINDFNDISNAQDVRGYIVEYDPVTNSVPEPAAMLLIGSGLIGLAGFKRRAGK